MRPLLLTILGLLSFLIIPTQVLATSFEGSYAGVHLGYRWADLKLETPAYLFPAANVGNVQIPVRSESFSLDGIIGGAHADYNVVQDKKWLFGIEADIDFGSRGKSRLASFATPVDGSEGTQISRQSRVSSLKVGWQGTLRARLGYIQDEWLFYGTAGIAFQHAEWDETISNSGGGSQSVDTSDLLKGWLIGGGIEKSVDVNAIARIEYLYEDFGSMSVPLAFSNSSG